MQRDILTLCHFWLILTNVGMFHLTLVHLHNTKFDKNLQGIEYFHVHEEKEGGFLNRWPTKLQIHL